LIWISSKRIKITPQGKSLKIRGKGRKFNSKKIKRPFILRVKFIKLKNKKKIKGTTPYTVSGGLGK